MWICDAERANEPLFIVIEGRRSTDHSACRLDAGGGALLRGPTLRNVIQPYETYSVLRGEGLTYTARIRTQECRRATPRASQRTNHLPTVSPLRADS
jgi:hypothetical protein